MVPPSPPYPWGQMFSGLCKQTPEVQHGQRLPVRTESKRPGLLRTVLSQDVGELTGSTEKGSIAAAPCPVTGAVMPSLGFTNPEPLPGSGEGLALKGTFWGPSQESAVTGVPPIMLGAMRRGPIRSFQTVGPTRWTCASRSQPVPPTQPGPGGSRPASRTLTLTGGSFWRASMRARKAGSLSPRGQSSSQRHSGWVDFSWRSRGNQS